VFLQRSRQRSFGLGQPAQMNLCDSLSDDRQRRGRTRRRGQFFVDVKGRLIFLTTLNTR
jgi:hypothetical protein